MLSAFFESIKYVNHLIPLAFLRIYIGYFWFQDVLIKYQTGLFTSQVFIDQFKADEIILNYPSWYQWTFNNLLYPYWHLVGPSIVGVELFIGIAFIIGFLVRPASFMGILICLHYIAQGSGYSSSMYAILCAIFFTNLLAGGGRCIGLDYYFFKRNRGIWW